MRYSELLTNTLFYLVKKEAEATRQYTALVNPSVKTTETYEKLFSELFIVKRYICSTMKRAKQLDVQIREASAEEYLEWILAEDKCGFRRKTI